MQVEVTSLDDDRVKIVISDDGVGMPESVLKRIFDPFFTTKLGHGGSGLGMNIVYNIVHDVLGGSIHVESAPYAGTRIILTLPCTAPTAKTA
jgi:signal transduction histidine kinase